MVDLAKHKKKTKNRFGNPPSRDEAGDNLSAPESAPIDSEKESQKTSKNKKKTRKKTGRTEIFGTRVSPKFLKEFRKIAFNDGLKLVELLEESLESYKREKGKSNKR